MNKVNRGKGWPYGSPKRPKTSKTTKKWPKTTRTQTLLLEKAFYEQSPVSRLFPVVFAFLGQSSKDFNTKTEYFNIFQNISQDFNKHRTKNLQNTIQTIYKNTSKDFKRLQKSSTDLENISKRKQTQTLKIEVTGYYWQTKQRGLLTIMKPKTAQNVKTLRNRATNRRTCICLL